MLIRRAEIAGHGPVDVRIEDGVVRSIGSRLSRIAGERTLEADGGALLPGLHDHHIHLMSLAAAMASVCCGPPEACDAAALGRTLTALAAGEGWVRGVGYHESVAGPLDRHRLDEWIARRPVRIQHRSGRLWILNTEAAVRVGLEDRASPPGVERGADGRATGRVFDSDTWLRERIEAATPPDLSAVSRRLAQLGVTGVTDATPDNDAVVWETLAKQTACGSLSQRVLVMGRLALPDTGPDALERGPVKCILHDDDLPPLPALCDTIREARTQGRRVAVHCVTRVQLFFAIAAFREAGSMSGDRIEHAALVPPEALAPLRELGLTVVSQPNFLLERGDTYLAEVDRSDRPWLYRGRGLVAAGVALGGGTDAPFGDPDPWRAMRAAVDRRSASGRLLGAPERLTPERALSLFTSPPSAPGGAPRRVLPGAPADLCLLDRPWAAARRRLASDDLALTVARGRVTYRRA